LHALAQLLDLPLPQVGAGVRTIDLLREDPDDLRAGGVGQALEFLEMFVDMMSRRRSLARSSDEDDALDGGREGDWFSANRYSRSRSESRAGRRARRAANNKRKVGAQVPHAQGRAPNSRRTPDPDRSEVVDRWSTVGGIG